MFSPGFVCLFVVCHILSYSRFDLSNLANWLDKNRLVINLKQGETDYVLFGMSKKLSKARNSNIVFRSVAVNEVESYEYLGVNMDKSLNYIEHKDKTHIKKYGMVHDFVNFPISGMNYERVVCGHVAQIAPTLYLLMKLFVLLVVTDFQPTIKFIYLARNVYI